MQHPDGFGQAEHFTLSSGLPPLTLTLMDDGWTEVRGWATPWAVGRARVNRSSLPILFLAAKSSQDRCRVNLSVREKKRLRLKQYGRLVR